MTKDFKCPVCGNEYGSAGALWYHKKKKHPDSIKSRGGRESGRRDASATVSQEASVTPSTATPAADSSFYPPFQDWRKAREEKTESTATTTPLLTSPSLVPAALDLTGLWRGLGDFIDEHMPKGTKVRVDMDDKKAAVLNEGLKQMGLVTLPAPTIIIPNWAPFMVTAAAVFGIPLMVMAKEFVASIRKDLKDRREAAKTPAPAAVTVANDVVERAAIPFVPTNIRPQPYHEPSEG